MNDLTGEEKKTAQEVAFPGVVQTILHELFLLWF